MKTVVATIAWSLCIAAGGAEPSPDELKALAKAIEKTTASQITAIRKKMPDIKRGKVPKVPGENMVNRLKLLQKGEYAVPSIDMRNPASTLGSLKPGWGRFKGKDADGYTTVELEQIILTGSALEPGNRTESRTLTGPGGWDSTYTTVRIKGLTGPVADGLVALPPIVKRTIDDNGESTFEAVNPKLLVEYLPKKLKQPLKLQDF